MRQRTNIGLALGALLLFTREEVNAAEPHITILVHDYAGIDNPTLQEGEREAARVFRLADIEIDWKQCYSEVQSPEIECPVISPTSPALRLVSRFQLVAGVRADTMGYSTGDMMTVSVEEADTVARSIAGPVGQVLGLIIAHELGHLLLGRNHSAGGIMRARWGLSDWVLARQGALVFLPRQAAALRTELHSRNEFAIIARRSP